MKVPKNVGITEFRKKISLYFKKAIKGEPVVIAKENVQAILINIDQYNELIEAYEDKIDAETLEREIKKNKNKPGTPWEDIKKELNL